MGEYIVHSVVILTSLTLSQSVHPSFVNNVTVGSVASFVTSSIIYIGPVTLLLLLLVSIDDELSLDDENDDENFNTRI